MFCPSLFSDRQVLRHNLRFADGNRPTGDTYQAPIGGYSDRRSLWGSAADLGLQCLPFSPGM